MQNKMDYAERLMGVLQMIVIKLFLLKTLLANVKKNVKQNHYVPP